MRLSIHQHDTIALTPHLLRQRQYADSILAIGEGRYDDYAIILDTDFSGSIMKVGLAQMKYVFEHDVYSALKWLYPDGFHHQHMQKTCILASKNESVDAWNTLVQLLNPIQEIHELSSHDYLCDVDDPFGYLANCLDEMTLNKFNANGIPKHILRLKINDICIVTRALKASDIATNSRVKFLSISSKVIKAQLLDESNRIVLTPKIRFKFKLEYGESYQMMRCQFPLRLAYCMTYNKSHSQTFEKILLDCIGEPFTHGHLYVATSRIRNCENIRLFITQDQLHQNPFHDETEYMPVITNVVYHKVLLR